MQEIFYLLHTTINFLASVAETAATMIGTVIIYGIINVEAKLSNVCFYGIGSALLIIALARI